MMVQMIMSDEARRVLLVVATKEANAIIKSGEENFPALREAIDVLTNGADPISCP